MPHGFEMICKEINCACINDRIIVRESPAATRFPLSIQSVLEPSSIKDLNPLTISGMGVGTFFHCNAGASRQLRYAKEEKSKKEKTGCKGSEDKKTQILYRKWVQTPSPNHIAPFSPWGPAS
jgi:hypothetical protein